jgi:hypothetical protein
MTTYLQITGRDLISKPSLSKKQIPMSLDERLDRILELIKLHEVSYNDPFSKLNDGVYHAPPTIIFNSDDKSPRLDRIIKLILSDSTNTVFNLVYTKISMQTQDRISGYIIYRYERDSVFYKMMDNNIILSFLRYCVDTKDYDLFTYLCTKLTSKYYSVMNDIIHNGDAYFMDIFAHYCCKSFYHKMINSKNNNELYPFDILLRIYDSYGRPRYDRHRYPYERNEMDDYLGLVTYFERHNAPSDRDRYREIFLSLYGPRLLNVVNNFTEGCKNNLTSWEELDHDNLVFNKLMLYLV